MDVYIGFDSAWTDNRKAPGAICAVAINNGCPHRFHAPRLASFNDALALIQEVRSTGGVTLIALDQPCVVPNRTGMRPVERVAASVVSWLGGGVQPSNRGKLGMFCDDAPVWQFLARLGAVQDPEQARKVNEGLFLVEVFPALSLASFDPAFFAYLGGSKYNPDRKKTFRRSDWTRVACAAARKARDLGCDELADWCRRSEYIAQPRKADQDKIDAALCVLIALLWRLRPWEDSLVIGNLVTGYMVLPASSAVRERLIRAAQKHAVEIDGIVLQS